ncbi:leucyl aminopeptidase [Nocardioides flavus (ex Wang et al. 2016)]|uniref:Probable cytosol aminopeptidase n=1 Tax=Nocardioides flavus (ex Wang et al. 2016) TaxID=2058780 RepID=A0ABQ3HMJ0_9ACTN|nr:leucyl aminopeptidase family protein [Nocardioides flavus (ex Wang et al. 2016)]GHE17857.1 leucyl aminopeptidase [Nocardioides flavus (ex Wang et al. 2016)]
MPVTALPTQVSPPEFALSPALPHQIGGAEVWAYPVLPGEDGPFLGPGADEAGEALGLDLLAALEVARATGRTGEVTTVPVGARAAAEGPGLVLLVGVGEATTTDFRRAGAALARATKDRASVVTTLAAIAPDDGLESVVVGAMLGSFAFHWRSGGPKEHPVARIVLAGVSDDDGADDELARALALGGAGWRSRALATVPANLKTPAWLAEQAIEVGEAAGLEVSVWDAEQLEAEGFGGILAVGGGSANEPRLIRMDYTPRGATRSSSRKMPTVVLVGKGITFDSGGLDIKPAEGMLTMKRDMSGGGAVIAAMAALGDVDCPVRVVGLVPAAENAVSGTAMRPGDVITHFGGRTSEVNNTDAEGRLVLADAMAYAVSEIEPVALLDIATLTGAMKVSLGQWTGGYFANHEGLAAHVEAATATSGENAWRMPLVADYEDKIASKIADGDNAAGGAGAITAALFLQHFAGDVPWAHVDFASAAESPTDRHEWTAGPSGWGPRLLLAWLGSDDPLAGIV